MLATGVTASPSIHGDFHGVEPIVRRHMELVLSGAGVLMPGTEPYEEDCGIVTYGSSLDDWPPLFRLGLKGEWQNGILVHPFSVRLDDDTGNAVFFDKDGIPIHSVDSPIPFVPASWNRILWNLPSVGAIPDYRALSHVVSRYRLVHAADAEELAGATRPKGIRIGRLFAAGPTSFPNALPRFRVSEFSPVPPTNMTLRITWEEGFFTGTNRIVDVWHGPDITTSRWCVAASADVVSATDCEWTFHLNETNFPWYVPPMDCTNENCSCPCCRPVVSTNLVFSGMDPGSTNAVWTISTNTTCNCPRGVSAAFFKVWPHWDQDGDGILDLEEVLNTHSDPLLADTDGDGMNDGWETLTGLDPCDATGENGRDGDPDADGVSNAAEMASHTHPLLADTDGDGVPDGISETAWQNHNLWGARNGNTNLLLRIDASIPTNSAATSAALRLGTLTIPLGPGENQVALCLQQGRLYDFHLGCTGGAQASIAIGGEPGLPGLSVDVSSMAFSAWPRQNETNPPKRSAGRSSSVIPGMPYRSATGTIHFPRLELFTTPQTGLGACVHEFPGARTYRVASSPLSWSSIQDRAIIQGFSVGSDGTVSLSVSDTPPSVALGSISLRSSISGLADYRVERTIHRCEADPTTGLCPKCGDLGHDVAMTGLSILRPALDKARVGSTNRTAFTAYCTPQGVQAPNWSITPDDDDGARLHASDDPDDEGSGSLEGRTSVWISPGTWTNQYTVTATFPFDAEKSSSRPFTAMAIDAEPISAETNENGIVYNPCMTILGETAQFKVNVWPESIPDNAIVWSVSGDGAATFPNGPRGRIVTLRGDAAGDVTLTVSIDGYNGVKPTYTTRISSMWNVPVVAWIGAHENQFTVNATHVFEIVEEANNILRQVCVSCYVHQVLYTNSEQYFNLRMLSDECFRWAITDILSAQNPADGIEIHFVSDMPNCDGKESGHGIVMSASAPATTFAHEVGHALGLPDIFPEISSRRVSGYVSEEWAPMDWSGSDPAGFYPMGLRQSDLIRRHIMYGIESTEKRDFSAGGIYGLYYREGGVFPMEGRAPVGINSGTGIHWPHHE